MSVRVLDDYEILGALGSGAHSLVWQARKDGRDVAIKEVPALNDPVRILLMFSRRLKRGRSSGSALRKIDAPPLPGIPFGCPLPSFFSVWHTHSVFSFALNARIVRSSCCSTSTGTRTLSRLSTSSARRRSPLLTLCTPWLLLHLGILYLMYCRCLVLEPMSTDLARQINGSACPLDLSYRRLFTYQLLRALKAVHSAGVVHRDIVRLVLPGPERVYGRRNRRMCSSTVAASSVYATLEPGARSLRKRRST